VAQGPHQRGGVDWRTWGEARADFDRALEAVEGRLERRIQDMEDRVLERVDELVRRMESSALHQRDGDGKMADRVRDLEKDVTELRTTNKLLAAVFSGLIALLGVALAAVAAWKH
jgi:hypothetical protein